jgi:phage-related tail protein
LDSRLKTKINTCEKKKSNLVEKHASDLQEMKDTQSEFGDSYCQHTLDLREARIEEFKIEIDICQAEESNIDMDSLKRMFDMEK